MLAGDARRGYEDDDAPGQDLTYVLSHVAGDAGRRERVVAKGNLELQELLFDLLRAGLDRVSSEFFQRGLHLDVGRFIGR